MGETIHSYIRTNLNPADILTKPLTGQKRQQAVETIMYDLT